MCLSNISEYYPPLPKSQSSSLILFTDIPRLTVNELHGQCQFTQDHVFSHITVFLKGTFLPFVHNSQETFSYLKARFDSVFELTQTQHLQTNLRGKSTNVLIYLVNKLVSAIFALPVYFKTFQFLYVFTVSMLEFVRNPQKSIKCVFYVLFSTCLSLLSS